MLSRVMPATFRPFTGSCDDSGKAHRSFPCRELRSCIIRAHPAGCRAGPQALLVADRHAGRRSGATTEVRLDQTVLEGLAGNYASPMGLIEVHPRAGRLLARVMGLPLELIPRADGSLTAELSLLGVVSVPVSQLASLRISPFESGGQRYLRITTTGILAGVAERLPKLTSEGMEGSVRTVRYCPRGENASYRWPREISLQLDNRTGLMLLSYLFPGQRSSFPLLFPVTRRQ